MILGRLRAGQAGLGAERPVHFAGKHRNDRLRSEIHGAQWPNHFQPFATIPTRPRAASSKPVTPSVAVADE